MAEKVSGAAIITTYDQTYVILLPPGVTEEMVEDYPIDSEEGFIDFSPDVGMVTSRQELYDAFRKILGKPASSAN